MRTFTPQLSYFKELLLLSQITSLSLNLKDIELSVLLWREQVISCSFELESRPVRLPRQVHLGYRRFTLSASLSVLVEVPSIKLRLRGCFSLFFVVLRCFTLFYVVFLNLLKDTLTYLYPKIKSFF